MKRDVPKFTALWVLSEKYWIVLSNLYYYIISQHWHLTCWIHSVPFKLLDIAIKIKTIDVAYTFTS